MPAGLCAGDKKFSALFTSGERMEPVSSFFPACSFFSLCPFIIVMLYCPSSVKKVKLAIFSVPKPPATRNPNYRGSRCLTLTSGQPMYSNVGAKIKGGITV
jgi:hypothetical protein